MSVSATKPLRFSFSPWQFAGWLALLVFAAFPQVILGVESFVARDYGFFAYPLAHFQRDCFWHGQLPFWDPYNNCGVPFLAQWNTMPLYPPSLLYLTLPLAWSLPVFGLLHLWWAGMGMYFLTRRWTGNHFAAAFAGTVFAFNGFTLNLLMWPSHIATFSWLPWVIFAVESAWREGGKKIPAAAAAGALQMLAGGPETIFLTWLIALALWLQQLVQRADRLELEAKAATPWQLLWRFPLVVGLVVTLTLPQLLPFLDLVAHAQRATGYTDLRWSMPGTGLANFLVPMAFGSTAIEGIFFQRGQYWTSSYYLGIGTVWLALLAVASLPIHWKKLTGGQAVGVLSHEGLANCARFCSRRIWLLTVLGSIGLLCALGENTPFYPFVRKLIPQLSFITYPIKFVLVVVFVAPVLAAFALAQLCRSPGTADQRRKVEPRGPAEPLDTGHGRLLIILGAVLLALLAGVLFWTLSASAPGDDVHAALMNGLGRAGFLLMTGMLLVSLWKFPKGNWQWLGPALLALTAWLDVSTHEPRQNPTVPPNVFAENLVRAKLAMQPQPELGGSRAMLSPAAALGLTQFAVSNAKDNFLAKRVGYCADVNLLDAVPKVDGFFSLTPREFDGLLSLIYSATNGVWSHLENFMGVSQISAPDNFLRWETRPDFSPLITAGQKPVFVDDTNALWAFGRNDFDGANMVFLPPEEKALVTVTHQTDARILKSTFGYQTVDVELEAKEPSIVVIAQSYYHNWRAEVDGQTVPLLRANVAFQAVQVPAQARHLHLTYRDERFEIGAAISICMWVNCFVAYLALRRRELPPSPAPKDSDYF